MAATRKRRTWIAIPPGSHLGLCLVFTFGTPVADVLAHSLLPLIIDYSCADRDITAEEEGRIVIEQHDRVRRVRLQMPRMSIPNLQKLVMAIDEEYTVLEYLVLESPKKAALMFSETLQAPHLVLTGFALPTGPRLLTTAVGLVTLALVMNLPSAYFRPNILL